MGGKFARIGGATDLREVLGDGLAELIKERGRWKSDVAKVYQRALVKAHLEASARLSTDQTTREMEDMCKGWAQPASLR